MYKYLPADNQTALKASINEAIMKNNISSSKVAKAINVDTSSFKKLRNEHDSKQEISPKQYLDLNEFFKSWKITLDLGPVPVNYFDRFVIILFTKGKTVIEFCSEIHMSKQSLKKLFTNNGVSMKYRDKFKILTDEEFALLSSYKPIVLSHKREAKIVKAINAATNINYLMIKRGLDIKSFSKKIGYNITQTNDILQGFITDGVITAAAKALAISETAITCMKLNSESEDNDFGYFLQKTLLENKYNVWTFSRDIFMNYCDVKGILSGSRNIKEDEFDKIANALNLDLYELKEKAPKNIKEGDDRFIPYNFLKWYNEHPEVPSDEISKAFGKKVASLVYCIKNGRGFVLPDITVLMTVTGLSKEDLRSYLTDYELETIKSTKRQSGVKKKASTSKKKKAKKEETTEKVIPNDTKEEVKMEEPKVEEPVAEEEKEETTSDSAKDKKTTEEDNVEYVPKGKRVYVKERTAKYNLTQLCHQLYCNNFCVDIYNDRAVLFALLTEKYNNYSLKKVREHIEAFMRKEHIIGELYIDTHQYKDKVTVSIFDAKIMGRSRNRDLFKKYCEYFLENSALIPVRLTDDEAIEIAKDMVIHVLNSDDYDHRYLFNKLDLKSYSEFLNASNNDIYKVFFHMCRLLDEYGIGGTLDYYFHDNNNSLQITLADIKDFNSEKLARMKVAFGKTNIGKYIVPDATKKEKDIPVVSMEDLENMEDKQDPVKRDEIDKEFDKFLELFEMFNYSQQLNTIKILAIAKNRNINISNIPEELLDDNRLGFYKRVDFILSLYR